jgi:hypothetical protein
MANLPRGHAAYVNPVARELVNPADAQFKQSMQQAASQQGVREEAREAAANALAQHYKSSLQQMVGAAGVPNLAMIKDNPDLVRNLGMA